jgi:predicted nucleic acid-binding protein
VLFIEALDFVNNAKTKGLIPKDDNRMIDDLIKNEMFTDVERSFINHYMAKSMKP